jgi:hypothetical protein
MSDPILNEKMARVGEILNLQPHLIQGKTICGPGDIEGHKGAVRYHFYVSELTTEGRKLLCFGFCPVDAS